MLTGLIILEDNQVKFTIHDAANATVTVCDGTTGTEQTLDCGTEELAASLALAIASDEGFDRTTTDALYKVAERLQASLNPVLRMIP